MKQYSFEMKKLPQRTRLMNPWKWNEQTSAWGNSKDTIKTHFWLTSYVVLDYVFEYIILSIVNLNLIVQQFNINPYTLSSIKETNWLVSKGMHVILFDIFNECSLVKKKNR